MNFGPIVNLTAGGKREARSAYPTYSSCRDMSGTQTLNLSQSWMTLNNRTAVQLQTGQKTAGFCPDRVTNTPRHRGSGFWPGLEPNQTELPVNARTPGG
jgi:hypothetical protein